VRQYTVQVGDSPASIAAQDSHAGCPKCARDLVSVNSHRAAVRMPNGFITFRDPLRVGEVLNLPDRWFDGTLDRLPKSYFELLPHYDGVTPVGTAGVGLAGTLGDFPTLDAATTAVSLLDTMGDREFAATAGTVIDAVDFAMNEVGRTGMAASVKFATDARTALAYARQRTADMNAAINVGNQPEVASARSDIRQSLATALGSARLALQSYYGGAGPLPTLPPQQPVEVVVPPQPVASTQKGGISAGAMFGWAAAIAVVGGGIYYWKKRPRVRRVYEHGYR